MTQHLSPWRWELVAQNLKLFVTTIDYEEIVMRRRVSKYTTNASKIAVMDVILGSLCVSLGSSTVQLHDSLGSRRECTCSEAGFSSQNGYRT
jgi:hypothetical protein